MTDPKPGSNEAGIARADSEASNQALQKLALESNCDSYKSQMNSRRRNSDNIDTRSKENGTERVKALIHRGSNYASMEESALDTDDMFDVITTSDNINALHLHLPSTPGQTTTNIILPLSASKERRGSVTLVAPDPVPHNRPGTLRVRFRSRVRIGSGRHTNRTASIDSSPSSSISAPLRYAPDELDNDIPQSYGAYTYQRKPSSRRSSSTSITNASSHVAATSRHRQDASVSEQTPLLRAPGSRLGAQTRKRCGLDEDDDESETIRARRLAIRKEQEEAVFGKWPYRLLNGYWWIWKCEPVLCCCCPADDSDSEAGD